MKEVEVIEVLPHDIIDAPKSCPVPRSLGYLILVGAGKGLVMTGKGLYKTAVVLTPVVIKTVEVAGIVLITVLEGTFKLLATAISSKKQANFYFYRNEQQVDNYVPPVDAHIEFLDSDLKKRFYRKHSPNDPRDMRRTKWD